MYLQFVKFLFVIIVIACFVTSITFYFIRNKFLDKQNIQKYNLPSLIYNDAFVIIATTLVFISYLYSGWNSNFSNPTFIISSAVLLGSYVYLYAYLYYNLTPNSQNFTQVRSAALNIVINTLVLIISSLYINIKYKSATFTLFPMLALGAYYLFIGVSVYNYST